MNDSTTPEQTEPPADLSKSARAVISTSGLLKFIDAYNVVADNTITDEFFDALRLDQPDTAATLAAICGTDVTALNDKAIQSSPMLRICFILAGDALSPRQLTKDEMQAIFSILMSLTLEELAKPLDFHLFGAFHSLFYTQWRAVHFSRGITASKHDQQAAWVEWHRNHGPVCTNEQIVRMLFALMRDIVLN